MMIEVEEHDGRLMLEIPPEIASKLGIRAGTEAFLHVEGETLIVIPRKTFSQEEFERAVREVLTKYRAVFRRLARDGGGDDV